MTTVKLDEADLAGLLARVRMGEEIVIAEEAYRSRAPCPSVRRTCLRRAGPGARRLLKIMPGFDDPLPQDSVRGFSGKIEP